MSDDNYDIFEEIDNVIEFNRNQGIAEEHGQNETEILINRCIEDDKKAWNVFFDKYTDVIIGQIIYTFRKKNLYDLAKSQDAVGKIFKIVYDKLYNKKKIRNCNNPDNPIPWLKTIASNATRDWLRETNADKNAYKAERMEKTKSIDANINQENTTTWHGIIPSPELPDEEEEELQEQKHEKIKTILENIYDEIDRLTDDQLWIFRLKLFYYKPLKDHEIKDLADYVNKDIRVVESDIQAVVDELTSREKGNDDLLESAVKYLAIANKKQKILKKEMATNEMSEKDISAAEKKIESKREKAHEKSRKGMQPILPKSKAIADILNLKNETQVNNTIHKINKKLETFHRLYKNIIHRIPDIEADVTFIPTAKGGKKKPAVTGYEPDHFLDTDYLISGQHFYINKNQVKPGETERAIIWFTRQEAYPQKLWVGKEIKVQEKIWGAEHIVGYAKVLKINNKLLKKKDEKGA